MIFLITLYFLYPHFANVLTNSLKQVIQMQLGKDTGLSLGFLAGTTLGSGIAFLFQFQAYEVISSVAFFGIVGALSGLGTAVFLRQRQRQH